MVSESAEIVDVSPAMSTNFIGQKMEKAVSDTCERSCEELSSMFQELKGLRIVVGNLMDGLQKVVSHCYIFFFNRSENLKLLEPSAILY